MELKIRDDLQVEDFSGIGGKLERLESEEDPMFVTTDPDFGMLREAASRYKHYNNIIVIGYGGSNTSFLSYFKALYKGDKRVEILNTVDPVRLQEVRSSCNPEESLLILISKSGTTAGVLEAFLHLKGYPAVIITEDNDLALSQIASKRGIERIIHPQIGGRFSGRTASAYFPAAVLDLPIEEIDKGYKEAYAVCGPKVKVDDNPALRLAACCYLLEERGYNEIFMPIYSPYLDGVSNLVVQLVHESSCKHGKGQTIYTAIAPESQHHTNQRFFGGKRNVIGMFIDVMGYDDDPELHVDDDIGGIAYKDADLKVFEGLSLGQAMTFELAGTYQSALDKSIPAARIELERLTPKALGNLMGLMQYFAVYASVLRDVNPFDQPHVEDSKRITIELIRNR